MLEVLQDLPTGIEGLKAVGKVSQEDYALICEPLLEAARRDGHRLRFLYQFGPEFEGLTPGGAWADVQLGLRSLKLFDGCAIVTDVGWIRQSAQLAGFLMPCPVRVFSCQERDQAVEWLASLPEGAGVRHRLIAETGVIVVEVTTALRAQDFDALSATADTWIAAHGDLQGLVIHTREFPGWENFGSLVRHIRFIHDHHQKIRRIALAADTKLASLAPRVAEHFVKAEIKTFGYDEIASAIAWAGDKSTAP
jgi:hypothetical protein